MGSTGYWLPLLRSLSAVVGPAHWPLELAAGREVQGSTPSTVDKQSASELSSWKDHFKQAPSARYLSPAHGRVNLNI